MPFFHNFQLRMETKTWRDFCKSVLGKVSTKLCLPNTKKKHKSMLDGLNILDWVRCKL